MKRLANIYWLGLKELRSVGHDLVLLGFMIYSFSFAVYSQATGISHELRNASIANVDQDRTDLSGRIAQAFLAPYFKPPAPWIAGSIRSSSSCRRRSRPTSSPAEGRACRSMSTRPP